MTDKPTPGSAATGRVVQPEREQEQNRRSRPSYTDPLPPLPTNLDDWHATVRLYRIPDYLRARADEIERGRPSPDPRSVADLFADLRNPSPEQLRARVDRLRAESARLSGLAAEIEEGLHAT